MKLSFLVILYITFLSSIFGQTITGIVLDKDSEIPITYVSIGIINKTGGTYSDDSGKFSITVSALEETDSLRFSSIGYRSVSFSMNEIKEKLIEMDLKVFMVKEIVNLRGVSIFTHKYRKKFLGNKISNRHVCICGSNEMESGIIIKNKDKLYLDKISFSFSSDCSKMPDSALIRINIYNTNQNLPSELVLHEPIIVLLSKELYDEKINVDIRKYNVSVEGEFAATIEILKKYGNGRLCFAGWVTGNPTIYKYGKQGKWAYPADDKREKLKIYQAMTVSGRIEK